MTREQILSAIQTLAQTQGFYGRLYERIREDESILDTLEAQNFRGVVDMVMWFEC